jgi:Fe2+ or Zn2+ uptake regulation protein
MKNMEKKIASLLRRRGHRVTPQRRAVLKVIARSQDHLTPAEIHRQVLQAHPGIGLVSIYRTLALLTELGLICEVHVGGVCRSYLLRRPSEHHHHLVCSDCGNVVDFSNCDLGELEKKLAEDTGFDIEGHLLEFAGRCPGCQGSAAA